MASERVDAWKTVYEALPSIRLELEAEMYASKPSYEAIRESRRDLENLIGPAMRHVLALDPEKEDKDAKKQALQLLSIAAKALLHAASLLASDVRAMLGLGRVQRERRLYDAEHRKQFQRDAHLKDRYSGLGKRL
jgi:hypothetical protein